MSTLVDKRGNFTLVENELFKFGLSPYEGWLYMVLLSHLNRQTGVAMPGIKRLSEISGIGDTKVKDCIRSLIAKGLIIKRRRFVGKQEFTPEYEIVSLRGMSPDNPPLSSDDPPWVATQPTPDHDATHPGSPRATEQESLTKVFNQRDSNQTRVQEHTASPTGESLLKKRLQERGNQP